MSLQGRWQAEIPAEIRAIGEALFAPDSVYRLVGEQIGAVLSEDDFAAYYSARGRGAISPVILALVTLFQYQEGVPDREAAALAVSRLDWKYALHVPLLWTGFDYSDLCNFRKRLLAHGAETLLFDKVVALIRELGFLKRYRHQRTDSTHVLGHVAQLGRLELLSETLRLAVVALQQAAPAWGAAVLPAVFVATYTVRRTMYGRSAAELQAEMLAVGQAGAWLLARVATAPAELQTLAAVATLQAVWAQQFVVPASADGALAVQLAAVPAAGAEPEGAPAAGTGADLALRTQGAGPGKSKDEIKTPHDPAVRWFQKRHTSWIGYKVHVTETAAAGVAVQFITDLTAVAANAGDSEAVATIQARLQARGLRPRMHYVDQGYTSGTNLAHSLAQGITLLGPIGGDTSATAPGFRLADFALDFATAQATCPQGHTVPLQLRGDPPGSAGSRATFQAHCAACPVRSQCTRSTSRLGRRLQAAPYYWLVRARRRVQTTPAFQAHYRRRRPVEGTLSELVRGYDIRRARYRGPAKVAWQLLCSGAAANLHRLARAVRLRREHPTLRVAA